VARPYSFLIWYVFLTKIRKISDLSNALQCWIKFSFVAQTLQVVARIITSMFMVIKNKYI
jgi:hypothetical protein